MMEDQDRSPFRHDLTKLLGTGGITDWGRLVKLEAHLSSEGWRMRGGVWRPPASKINIIIPIANPQQIAINFERAGWLFSLKTSKNFEFELLDTALLEYWEILSRVFEEGVTLERNGTARIIFVYKIVTFTPIRDGAPDFRQILEYDITDGQQFRLKWLKFRDEWRKYYRD